MTENQILSYCKELLLEKINKGHPNNWSDKDFTDVSNKIYNSTLVRLSVSSLKRIFGRIKYSSSPQRETKNALVRYLGFEDWDMFCEGISEKNKSNTKLKTSLLTKNKPIVILIFLTVLLTVLILFWYLTRSNINITVEKNKGIAPFQTVINYEITGRNKNKTYLINFDDFLNNYEKLALPYEKKTITHTYHYGDVYRIQVYSKTDTIAKFPVVVETKNWQHVLAVFGNPNLYVTLEPNYIYSTNSILYIDPKIVADHGIDTLNKYWIKHRYIKNFDLDGNNFKLDVRARIQSKLNGLDCPEIDIAVPCLNEIFKFKVFYPGCGSIENTTIFGEKRFDGTYTDLSNFGYDITKWTNVTLMVKNKQVKVTYNDSVVYQTVYKSNAGPVKGILFNTLRSAEVDFVRLSDLEGNIVFEEDF